MPLGLVISGLVMPLLIEILPTESMLRLLDGVCYLVATDKMRHGITEEADVNVFALILGVIMVALRIGEVELVAASNLVDFKEALVHTLSTMLDAEALLRNAMIEMNRIGVKKIKQLRIRASEQQEEEEGQNQLNYCMNIARSKSSLNSGLTEDELALLMSRVLLVAGSISEGRVTKDQFDELLQSVNPQMNLTFKEKMYRSVLESDGTVCFQSLASCISALCGTTPDKGLNLMFEIFDDDNDGALSNSEAVQLMMSILPLIYEGKLSDEEMEIMCNAAFEELDKDSNGCLSFEEFSEFTVRFPVIAEFLEVQCQRCCAAIFACEAEDDQKKNCPIQ